MADRPDHNDLAAWNTRFTAIIDGVDARTRDPDVQKFTRRLRQVAEDLAGGGPTGAEQWGRLRDVIGVQMNHRRGSEAKTWDEIMGLATDGHRMAKGLDTIRTAHAPYCDSNREPMTETGGRWRCRDGRDCRGRHWDFDGALLTYVD